MTLTVMSASAASTVLSLLRRPTAPSRPGGGRRLGMNMNMNMNMMTNKSKSKSIRSEVALKPESESESSTLDPAESEELKTKLEQVGSRVRLKTALKVYHLPRVPEVELPAGTEGLIKQYVGFWKGKRISANFPYKIEFQFDVPGRGPVKFFAHLKEDEFDLI